MSIDQTNSEPGPKFIRALRSSSIVADEFQLLDILWLSRLLSGESEIAEEEGVSDLSNSGELTSERPPKPPISEEVQPKYRDESIEVIVRKYEYEQGAVYAEAEQSDDGKIRVARHRVAGVPALPEASALAKSFRPLRRYRQKGPGIVDEVATVEHIAETDLILPVVKGGRERYFDAVVVLDDRASMIIWRETAQEFTRMLRYNGVFRDASLIKLITPDEKSELCLLSMTGDKLKIDLLNDPEGQRIIFLLSDGVAGIWRDGRMRRVIEKWGEQMPVVLVQVLGEDFWFRTVHGEPETRVRALVPGAVNRRLVPDADQAIHLPVVMPYPISMGKWARMLASGGEVLALSLDTKHDQPMVEVAGVEQPKPSIDQLYSGLSPTARQLISFLSAVPLQPGVMRLVQRVMLPDSRIDHLAEVMLSGMVKRKNESQDVFYLPDEEIFFDFIDNEARQWLVKKMRFGELKKVLDNVSVYLTERLGRRFDLIALISDSNGDLAVPNEALPFAQIANDALEAHGISHRRKTDRFVEVRANGRVRLTPFRYETVSLDLYGNEIRRNELEAWGFAERLDDNVQLLMVRIMGGSFLMGSPESEVKRSTNEGPQHEVDVPDFYIGKFTITQAQWRVVAGWEKVGIDLNPEPSYFPKDKSRRRAEDDQRPVENVSWFEAQEFCARLTRQTSRVYRLPSEAEWEYACRAGTTTPFAFGPTVTPEYVNYDGNYPYGNAKKGRYRQETIPVGSLGVANGWGVYDMHGNVWEWCEDHSFPNYDGAPTDGRAHLADGEEGRNRRLRGGSWDNFSNYCRSAIRADAGPGSHNLVIGLRVVFCARTS